MQTTHGGPATDTFDDPKRAARQLYRDRRRSFVAALDTPARAALERSLADIAAALRIMPGPVASYAAMGDEIDPVHVEASFGPHAFPRVVGKDLTFHLAEWKALVPGYRGIPEPPARAPEVTPRLLLVPLIAATLAGVRLGQGGGFYDRTLARLRAGSTPTIAVGLAWECQIADMLPRGPHDQLLDWVATPQRLVDCGRHR